MPTWRRGACLVCVCVSVEERGIVPSRSSELALTKPAWFSFLPHVAGFVEPLPAVGWSRSSLWDGAGHHCVMCWLAGTLVLPEHCDVANVLWGSPGSHGLVILAGRGFAGSPATLPCGCSSEPRCECLSRLLVEGQRLSACASLLCVCVQSC